MVVTVYLQGSLSADGQRVSLPLSSCAVLLVVAYTQPSAFHLAFVHTDDEPNQSHCASACVSLPHSGLSSLAHEFLCWSGVPGLVRQVCLPAVLHSAGRMVRSGLCVVVRHLVTVAHTALPDHDFLQLLGFRQGSLRMCAEVSGWTKLCEVEVPHSLAGLLQHIHRLSVEPTAEARQVLLPVDLVRLEAHFQKPPKVHNDDRQRRSELAALLADLADPDKGRELVHSSGLDGSSVVLERGTQLKHGWRKIRVEKQGVGGQGERRGDGEEMAPVAVSTHGEVTEEQLNQVIHNLTYLDVHFIHLYSEGVEMTIADLCLFSYLYFLLDSVQFQVRHLERCLPRVTAWLSHMVTLPRLRQAAARCAFHLPPLHLTPLPGFLQGGNEKSSAEGGTEKSGAEGGTEKSGAEGGTEKSSAEGGTEKSGAEGGTEKSGAEGGTEKSGAEGGTEKSQEWISFCLPPMEDVKSGAEGGTEKSSAEGGTEKSGAEGGTEKSSAEGGTEKSQEWISFCLPPMEDVTEDDMELRRCVQCRGIEPELGCHPLGSEVSLDWNSLPSCVHPREGEVPIQRVQRKCQQLQNLVTAVVAMARPGDVIVDFCSGGGHLGLAIAHLLPHCTVYLVENKEESLVRAQSRMATLPSSNVVLYQCNMDYFVGRFDVGVCLHACGSATDMVLHQCLHNEAAFVICPCCYGSIQQTHLLTYPRSRLYQDSQVTYKEFLTLGHAADQTEFNIALEQTGRQCMNLVDWDRAQLAREAGYSVTLTSLQPLTCSPKNNLLIGHKRPVSGTVNTSP